ncbi:hypothetical protein OF001_U150006 [Pseudomonas sp. OF001]|nr:hypothetical protein OF001_U150006 [Pseudomonas sp. OF001]
MLLARQAPRSPCAPVDKNPGPLRQARRRRFFYCHDLSFLPTTTRDLSWPENLQTSIRVPIARYRSINVSAAAR